MPSFLLPATVMLVEQSCLSVKCAPLNCGL